MNASSYVSHTDRTICVEYAHVTSDILTWVGHVGDFVYILL